jgi:uncharacterized protein (TIGR00251 family)
MLDIRADGKDVLLAVKVVPGASRTRVAGVLGDRLKVAVAAAPEKGKANAALTAYLAKTCGLNKRDVLVESGETSPLKSVRFRGTNVEAVMAALSPTDLAP